MRRRRAIAAAAPPTALARAAALIAALAIGALTATGAAADQKPKRGDQIWTHPDFASFKPPSVALLPAASYENLPDAERQVAAALGQALRNSGYRWVSSVTAREMLRSAAPRDSLLKVVREQILKSARVDSLDAPRLCARLRTRALLAVRIERWEQVNIEWEQSGKPSTTIQLRAALVDSLGRLLWSASGTEFAEGAYHEARPNPLAVKSSGLGTQPMDAESAPPSFEAVLAPLLARWAPRFPAKPAPAPPPAADGR